MSVGAVEKVPGNNPEPPKSGISDGQTTKDYYAWANVDFGADVVEGGFISGRKVASYGDKVTQKDLGIDDNEWQKLVDERVIRKSIPPKVGQSESPKRALIKQAKAAMDAALQGGE